MQPFFFLNGSGGKKTGSVVQQECRECVWHDPFHPRG